jgi:chaperonin GroEL
MKKDGDNKKLQKRLASLTNGIATIKVGGRTPIETQERLFRYEDAVNATRSAIKDGYLVGGGMALYSCYDENDYDIMRQVAKKVCEASVRQIAINSGKHEDTVLENTDTKKGIGYNAKTDVYEDLLKAGVIDPYKVTEMAIDNSISIAVHLLTSGYFIINKIENDKKESN